MKISDKSSFSESEIKIESLWLKYSLSLALLIISLLCLFGLLYHHVESQKIQLEQLNLARQQQVLAQKIALFVSSTQLSTQSEDQTEIAKKLNLAVKDFEKAHLAWVSGLMPSGREKRMSPEVAKIFFSTEELDKNSRRYINQGKDFLKKSASRNIPDHSRLNSLILSSSYTISENLTDVIDIFEQENDRSLMIFYSSGLFFLILIFVIVAVITLMIFRPLARSFRLKTQELSQRTETQKAVAQRRRQFISGIIPAIKQPLSHLKQSVFDIKNNDLSPAIAAKIHHIDASVKNVERLATLMIEYVSLEIDGSNQELSSVRLETLGKEIINSKIKEANLRGITLTLELNDKKEWFLLQIASIRSILHHILDNSLKNTPKGGKVTLKIDHHTQPDSIEDQEISFAVIDTGTGIDQDVRPHMFDMFTRGSIHRDNNTGAGLGLAIVSQIVKNLKADLSVQSKENQGSIFTLSLKAKNVAADQPPDFVRSSYYCLLAEDNVISQQFYSDILRDMGHSVLVVNDGASAVQAARTTRFDVILMDIMMPVMNGLEAAQKLKAEHKDCPPIITISSKLKPSDIGSLHAKDIDAAIVKPADKNDLQKIIDSLVRKDVNS